MKKIVKVGTRDSRLALVQAQIVIDSIRKHRPEIQFEIVAKSSFGDQNLEKSIESYDKHNLFSDKLEEALYSGEIDIAVHSYKDLPIYGNDALPIVALSKRENPFDALLLNPKIDYNSSLVIGTSCSRRALQLLACYPHWRVKTIRGAVPSRLQQMKDGKYDGLILAVAGLKRLGEEKEITKIFSPEEFIPSACQGIIAVQGVQNKKYDFLKEIDCMASCIAAKAELAFVRSLNQNGSSYNNGVYAEVSGSDIKITGMYITENKIIKKSHIQGKTEDGEALAVSLAEMLLKRGDVA